MDASGFDYASFSLRRPVPCPAGTYCHPGSSSEDLGMHNFTMPQPCLEVSDFLSPHAFGGTRARNLERRIVPSLADGQLCVLVETWR